MSLRKMVEADLTTLAEAGAIPDRGEREIRIRIDRDGYVKWFEAWRVRVSSRELEVELPSG